ncbi:MAG: hypothetical protein Q4D88_03430 [Anaerococcus sp.]|nr:hypothetical protein [Anaerococcus sp.]
MIRESFYRVFKRKRIFLIGLIIIAINILDLYPRAMFPIVEDQLILQSAYTENILGNGSLGKGFVMYIFLSFIIAALPMADSMIEDRQTGIIGTYLLKTSRKKYLRNRFVMNFIYGGAFVALTILINLLIWLLIRPTYDLTYFNNTLINDFFLIDLIVDHPIIFYILTLLRIFMVGGIMASFAMVLNDIFKSKFVGLGGVFLVDIIIELIVSLTSNYSGFFSHFKALTTLLHGFLPNVGLTSFIYPLILFLISLGYFFIIKKDRIDV